MKVMVIGASGTIGKAVVAELGQRHEIVAVGSRSGGIVAEQPIRNGASASMVNSAVEGFARGAAIELPRGLRINVVSPTVLEESMDGYGPFFIGFEPAPAKRVALSYARSIDGAQTGQVYRAW